MSPDPPYGTPLHWAILGLCFPRWSQRIAFWVTLYWFLAWGLLVRPPLHRLLSGLIENGPEMEETSEEGSQNCTAFGCLGSLGSLGSIGTLDGTGKPSDEPEERERREFYESDDASEF